MYVDVFSTLHYKKYDPLKNCLQIITKWSSRYSKKSEINRYVMKAILELF